MLRKLLSNSIRFLIADGVSETQQYILFCNLRYPCRDILHPDIED